MEERGFKFNNHTASRPIKRSNQIGSIVLTLYQD